MYVPTYAWLCRTLLSSCICILCLSPQAYQRVLLLDPGFTAARVNYCYLLLVKQNEAGAEVGA